jgi:hypothetical protein
MQGRAPPHGAPIAFHASFAVCRAALTRAERPTAVRGSNSNTIDRVVILRNRRGLSSSLVRFARRGIPRDSNRSVASRSVSFSISVD